jgi:hypothetical protein
MALGRRTRRSERAKLDATPPWHEDKVRDTPATTGPFDEQDAPRDTVTRLDLGALRIPIIEGLEVTVGLDPEGHAVEAALRYGGSEMRLVALAAPRTAGIWDDIRKQLRGSLASQGGTAQDSRGRFGTELTARVPVHGGYQSVRFVGVDGPRWMVQATFSGPAAVDATRAAALEDLLRGVVVVRGPGPMPVRDPLVLTLPERDEAAAQQTAGHEAPAVDADEEDEAGFPPEPGPAPAGPPEPASPEPGGQESGAELPGVAGQPAGRPTTTPAGSRSRRSDRPRRRR